MKFKNQYQGILFDWIITLFVVFVYQLLRNVSMYNIPWIGVLILIYLVFFIVKGFKHDGLLVFVLILFLDGGIGTLTSYFIEKVYPVSKFDSFTEELKDYRGLYYDETGVGIYSDDPETIRFPQFVFHRNDNRLQRIIAVSDSAEMADAVGPLYLRIASNVKWGVQNYFFWQSAVSDNYNPQYIANNLGVSFDEISYLNCLIIGLYRIFESLASAFFISINIFIVVVVLRLIKGFSSISKILINQWNWAHKKI